MGKSKILLMSYGDDIKSMLGYMERLSDDGLLHPKLYQYEECSVIKNKAPKILYHPIIGENIVEHLKVFRNRIKQDHAFSIPVKNEQYLLAMKFEELMNYNTCKVNFYTKDIYYYGIVIVTFDIDVIRAAACLDGTAYLNLYKAKDQEIYAGFYDTNELRKNLFESHNEIRYNKDLKFNYE